MNENGLPFVCKNCEIEKTVCYKCKLPCKNLKNHLTCFLCSKTGVGKLRPVGHIKILYTNIY